MDCRWYLVRWCEEYRLQNATSAAQQRSDESMKYLRGLAIAMLAVLALFTVVPADERPLTFLPHHVEHFVAFGIAGTLIGLAFAMETLTMLIASACFTIGLECVQIPLPSRHARLSDVVVDTVAICAGVLLARVGQRRPPR
jgi:VanZ family protein